MASLDEFATTRKPAQGAIERWFSEHEDVRAEVEAGFKKYPARVVWRWLRAEHGFPMSNQTLHNYRDRLQAR